MRATVLLLPYHAASLTNALVALAHTALELALLSHQANLILLPSSELMLPLFILAAILGTNGLDWACSLSHGWRTQAFKSRPYWTYLRFCYCSLVTLYSCLIGLFQGGGLPHVLVVPC